MHSHLHSPQLYVETLGNALLPPSCGVCAQAAAHPAHHRPPAEGAAIPGSGRHAICSAPAIWTQVAIEENHGNINLVDNDIRAGVPGDMVEAYARAARPALDAMNKFDKFPEEQPERPEQLRLAPGRQSLSAQIPLRAAKRRRSRQHPAAGRARPAQRPRPHAATRASACTARPSPPIRITPISAARTAKIPSSAKC